MKNIYLLIIFVALFSACAPAVNTPTVVNPIAPNVAAVYANQTAAAAQQQADTFNAQASATSQNLTVTAYAPISQMTQVAAELQIQQMYGAATTTAAVATQVAGVTQTAVSWTPTPNLTATVAVQAFLVQKDIDDKAAERREFNNGFWAWATPILFVLFVALVIIAVLTVIRHFRRKPIARDENGKTQPILDSTTGEYLDLSASPNYSHITKSLFEQIVIQWLEKKYGFVPAQPHISIARMDHVKDREQDIELERIHRPRRLPDDRKGQLLLTQSSADLSTKFLLPSWDIINGWDGKNGLPYYTANGLETFSVDKVPHLSVTGETGSGKTRRFLRPLIACALAAGYRVVIIGKSKDYSVFKHHPNADLIGINNVLDSDQALRYANILSAVVQEMNRRDEVLTSKNRSIWSQAGYVGTIIVCDEIGNSLNIMDKANRAAANQTRAWAEGLVAEGRAVGLHMWFGSQRATGMLGIYSQTRKAIFRVAPDEEAQHRSMSGASSLDDGYYLAKFSASKLAGGFEPSDEQINSFLNSRQVPKVENSADEWIDAIATDVPNSLPVSKPVQRLTDNVVVKPATTQSRSEFVNGLSGWEARVLDLYEARLDKTAILETVFEPEEYQIGRVAIDDLIQRWQIVKGATPANSQPAPVAFEQAMQDPEAEIDAQIRSLHAQGKSNTYIVYKIWDKSSAEFSDRMARVKRVLATASASEARETPENEPVAA